MVIFHCYVSLPEGSGQATWDLMANLVNLFDGHGQVGWILPMKMVVSWDMNGNIMRHITNYNHKLVCPYCGHPSIGLVQQLSFEVGEAS